MKCHYEVLGVEREATSSEIKTAYRKLALQWHPDKNIDDEQRAKEQFQLVQTAYEVLSDLHERAWYDKHRDQLLRGAGSEFTDDSLDVFPFMSPSCYRGFGDDEKGFYAVYREVFKKLATEESEFMENPEDVTKIPTFGDSATPYETVNEFYSHWMSFSTNKTFVWLDKHDIRDAHRKLVKVIEKEHAKVRANARRERNTAVRTLASYARRRDPRVKTHVAELRARAEQNRAKMEVARKERLAVQRETLLAEAEAEKVRRADEDAEYVMRLRDVEKQLQEEFGVSSNDQMITDEESGNDDDEYAGAKTTEGQRSSDDGAAEGTIDGLSKNQRLYCSACRKPFNTVPAFQNHEKSKKHRENVAKMSLNEEVRLSSDDDTSLPSEVTESVKKKKKKKKKKQENATTLDPSDLDQSNDDRSFAELQGGRKARKLDRKIRLLAGKRDPTDERDSESENAALNGRPTDSTADDVSPDLPDSIETSEVEKSRAQKAPAKKAPSGETEAERSCAVCREKFSSKNKLFDHLKKTGHQVALGAISSTSDIKMKRRSKR